MGLPFPGIGVVFDIEDLGGGFYGYEAWKIIMRQLDPSKLRGSTLLDGDTNETLSGDANDFCIAVCCEAFGDNDIEYVKGAFEDLTEQGLAASDRRFIENPRLDSEPLSERARIDAGGLFVTKSWTRVDHDLCKEADWGYRPESVPDDLSPELAEELKDLMERRAPEADVEAEKVAEGRAPEAEVEAETAEEDRMSERNKRRNSRMHRNPWFTMILGLMAGLIIGYVMAERQAIPPAKAIRLGLNPQAVAQQGEELPDGHPPVEGASGADSQRLRQQVAEIEGLLAANPDDAGLMAAMGNVYFDASRWPDARDWYEKALQLSSGDPNVLTDLAVVYRNLGDYERTIELLDQAIAMNSGHWQAWYNKVVVYQFDLHQHDDAADALKTLQDLKKGNSSIPDLSGLEQEVHGG